MQWHQRLDEEEAEVLSLERQLLSYNNVPHMVEEQKQHSNLAKSKIVTEKLTTSQIAQIQQSQSQIICEQPTTNRTPEKKRASRARKMEKRLKEIDKSLRELSHIPASSGASSGCIGQTNNDNDDTVSSNNSEEVDFVRTTGMKLNKLWKRLTSQQREKFEPNRRYKLCKTDLERLYEEAKMAVLKDFAENEERIAQELLEKTAASNISSSNSPTAAIQNGVDINDMGIPVLNLDFSSGHSEAEEESTNNSNTNNNKQGNYSPSVAEQNFKAQELLNSSISSETSSEQRAIDSRVQEENKRLENNLQMFSVLSQRLQTTNSHIQRGGTAVEGVQRSLSDTEISNTPKFITDKTTPSQTTSNVTIASQTNSITATEQHQRSKSSIVEMTNIPSVETQISDYKLNNPREEKQNEIFTESEHVVNEPSATITTIMPTRTSVIRSIGLVTSIHSQQTSAEVTTISEDTKQKTSFSGQFSTNTNTIAKEISNKLEEISAAVTQLSHMNALPSYESVTQSHQTKTKSTEESAQININDASNLSTDVSSYSFNFDNITTDKHSSPGTSTNPTNSIQNKTITSITYTQENDSELMSTNKETSSTSADANTSANTTKSKTFLKDDPATKSQPTLTQSDVENRLLDIYEADFESDLSNATHIEDITIPTFETTADTTLEDEDTDVLTKSTTNEDNTTTKDSSNQTLNNDNEILNNEKSTANIQTYVKPSPDKKLLPPPPPPLPPPPPPPPSINSSVPTVSFTTVNNQTASNHLMPDIINELELRRHQLIVDNEHLKQYEHVTAVPYMYVREIPNKPPPPYVPPAHGSPMTTIFPSEDRIKDITFRRTHELYCEFLKTDYCNETGDKLPSVMEEQITNIYERIILDICREYLEEHEEILRDGDPTNFHSQLAFFNPPNRLRCIQDAIYKEVRSCLAMDKTQPKRTQVYSVYGQRAKQDHIGKIIIQEMYDEDDRWCNFHREESEVLHLMVEEMIIKNITSIAKEVLLEEGGTVDEENIDENITEENAANKQNEKCLNDDNVQQQETESQISVLMETFNEKQDDQTYCIDETQQNCTVFNKTTTENHQPENVDLENSSTNTNVLKTCT